MDMSKPTEDVSQRASVFVLDLNLVITRCNL